MGRNRTGGKGKDVVLKVPRGTQVFAEDNETLITDMTEIGQRFRAGAGGNGGFGNQHFKTSTNQRAAPRQSGPAGEELTIWLRLKLIADIGPGRPAECRQVDLPAAITAAKPKIADYPFTTLHPGLGVVKVRRIDAREFVLADIPGLIEGAHEGAGLGDAFPRPCRALPACCCTAGRTVRRELKAYGGNLARKKEIVALNKTDAMTPEDIEAKRAQLAKVSRKTVHVISGVSRQGVQPLLHPTTSRACTRAVARSCWSRPAPFGSAART
jgi:GTP-binding protein